jgi:hypothetical protein
MKNISKKKENDSPKIHTKNPPKNPALLLKKKMSSSRRSSITNNNSSMKTFLLNVLFAMVLISLSVSPSNAQHERMSKNFINQNGGGGGGGGGREGEGNDGGITFASFEWEEKYGIPKVAIKFNNPQLRKWIESENLRRCAVKANTENGKECTQFMITSFLGNEAIPVEEAMESVARDRNLYYAFARQEKAQNERIQSLEEQRMFLAVAAFVSTIALGLHMYTTRAAGLKIPVGALFSTILAKNTAQDVEDKNAIRIRQVNEDAKARAKRLEEAIQNLKKNELRV